MPEAANSSAPEFINFDAQRWDLYTGKPGVDEAAADMTKNFNTLVAKAFVAMSTNTPPYLAINEVRREMEKVSERHSDFGATDSDVPLGVALTRVFGEDLQSLGAPRPARRSTPL